MKYFIVVIAVLSVLSTVLYTYPARAGNCTIVTRATYLLHNGSTITISIGEATSINVEGYVIPLHYNDTLLEKANITSIVTFIKYMGCCIMRYTNVRLITMKYGDVYIDLYYNESNKLLICAATEDYDLALLIDYETTTAPCTTSAATTTTTTQSPTATITPTTPTPSSSGSETAENIQYMIPIIVIIAITTILAYRKLRPR